MHELFKENILDIIIQTANGDLSYGTITHLGNISGTRAYKILAFQTNGYELSEFQ